MRCNKCQDQLYEYFDGTLKPSVCKSVQEHLAQCPDCRAVFEQERQFSKSVTGLFEQQTRDLSLAPQVRQNVMACPALARVVAGGGDPGSACAEAASVGNLGSRAREGVDFSGGHGVTAAATRNSCGLWPPNLIPPREFMKIAAVIAILLTGFYIGNTVWQNREAGEIMVKLEKGTDWRYILVSPRTCYFLNRPELQLMQ